jgi:hypothetical protein
LPHKKGRPRGGVVVVTHGGSRAQGNYEVTSSTFDPVNHAGVVSFSLDVTILSNLERTHLYEVDCWMVAVYENQVISIKPMKGPRSMSYMLHPRSSLLEVTCQSWL